MKEIKWFVVIIAFITGCISAGSPPSISTIIPTDTIRKPIETIFPTPSIIKINTPTPTPKPTITIEPTPENYQDVSVFNVPEGTVGCLDKRICFNMEPIDGNAMYMQMLDAWGKSPMLQDYWKNFGLNNPSGEELKQYFSQSVGGPENAPYWLPLVAEDGTEFQYLVGKSSNHGKFDVNTYLRAKFKEARRNDDTESINDLGIYIDRFPYAIFTLKDWNDNVHKREFINQILVDNWRRNDTTTLVEYGQENAPFDMYGMVYYKNRFLFLMGNKFEATFDAPWIEDTRKYNHFGGPESRFRVDVDPLIATAYWLTYTGLTAEWDETNMPLEEGAPTSVGGYRNKYICTIGYSWCEPYVNVKELQPEDALFKPFE
ncbi:MAG: hypothetical protein ACXAB4_02220 [Candidatus Hodarchaeales archaeon]